MTRATRSIASAWKRLRSVMAPVVPWAVPIVYVEWAVWMGLIMITQIGGIHADSTADWLVASAAADGLDPYSDLRALSANYDVAYLTPGWSEVGDSRWIHPRTPAALLLLQPATLLSPEGVHTAVIVLSLIVLALVGVFALPALGRFGWPLSLFGMSVALLSGPLLRGLQFGAWSVLLLGLMAPAWVGGADRDRALPGLAIGIAVGLRLFPALLLIPLMLFRRKKLVGTAVITALSLNLAGMVIFNISFSEVLGGLGDASDTWLGLGGNASLIKPLAELTDGALALAILLTLSTTLLISWVVSRSGDYHFVMSLSFVAMLLISPLSWEHYDVILFPAVAWSLAQRESRFLRGTASVWIVLMLFGFYLRQPWEQAETLAAGYPSLVGRLVLLSGLAAAVGLFTFSKRKGAGREHQPNVAT